MIADIYNKSLAAIDFSPAKTPAWDGHRVTGCQSLDTIIAGSDIALWALDVSTMRVDVCATFKRLLSLKEKQNYLFIELFRMIDSSYRRAFIKDLKSSCASPAAFTVEFMLQDEAECGKRWFQLSGKAYSQTLNHVSSYMGTLTDITATKTKELWNNDRLALLSHELKGPLSVIRLYLQRARKINSQSTIQDAAFFLTKADDQVSAMAVLMDNFLSFATIGNTKLRLCYEWFEVATVVNDLLIQMQMKHPNYHFTSKVPTSLSIRADKGKIIQVIQNYLNNAVKYSPANSFIEIKCEKSNGGTIFCVTDTGMGIEPALQEKVFERYYRTPGTNADGFGLGLYLVKEIVTEHGGNVWVQSAIDRGSSFYFNIPL